MLPEIEVELIIISVMEVIALKLEILPEGQELVKEVITLASKNTISTEEVTSADLATAIGDALMYYKILLDHKDKGGQIILKHDDNEIILPVVATDN